MKRAMLLTMVLTLSMIASVTKADFTFGEPTNLGATVNSSYHEWDPSISADGLSLFFESNRAGGSGSMDIWVSKRTTISDSWDTPVNLGPMVNSSGFDGGPCISADGLKLYFCSARPGGHGSNDLYMTMRNSISEPWGTPMNLGSSVNSSYGEGHPNISSDGLLLYFSDWDNSKPGGYGSFDIWMTTRQTTERMPAGFWGIPINLGSTVNSSAEDAGPSISRDGALFFFHSYRSGGSGNGDLWMTRRDMTSDPWGSPVNLGPSVNSSSWDDNPEVSKDGSMLYFSSGRSGGVGGSDLWQVSIDPIIDLNNDGIVDSADIVIMVDNWGTDNSLCDIGPMPWGDGIVDVEDLKVLAEHLFEVLPGRRFPNP